LRQHLDICRWISVLDNNDLLVGVDLLKIMIEALLKVFYDPGVGTLVRPDPWTKLRQDAMTIIGLVTDFGLDDNVLAALTRDPLKSMSRVWRILEWMPKADKYKEWGARRSFLEDSRPDAEPRPIPLDALVHEDAGNLQLSTGQYAFPLRPIE
jgi:hypothetical protein